MKLAKATEITAAPRKLIAILVTLALTLTLSLVQLSQQATVANAGTNVNVVYNGNTIGTAVPANATVDRDVIPLPAATEVSGSRTGYTFGGWSLAAGGPALTGSTYALTSTAERIDLYAVWNTKVNYNSNGADSGSLAGGKVSDDYRFGQTLTLPTAGTMVKAGFAFGGWMATASPGTRITSYQAATDAVGNPTLYAAWIKTVAFNANGATVGTTPATQTFVSGGQRLKLPTISEMTLRRTGYDFVGWSTSPTGKLVSNPTSYVPVVAQRTLFAIWQIKTTKASSRVFFAPGLSKLRAAQKLVLRDLVDSLKGRTEIKISLAARRHSTTPRSLGKARNTAVANYLRSLGVEATFTRTNKVGAAGSALLKKNNRVSIEASWTNPAS